MNSAVKTSIDSRSHGEGPALVAHRGDAQHYPENTLLALEMAVEAGAHYLECDIQLTKDAVPVLLHDDNLLRTAGLDKSVFDLEFSELRGLSVGESARFGDQFQSERIISLLDLSTKLNRWPHVQSFIEIKQESIDHFGLEFTVDAILTATASLTTPHMLISFNQEVVSYTKSVSDRLAGWVITDWGDESNETIEQLAPDCVFCDYNKIPKDTDLSSLLKIDTLWVLYEVVDPEIAFHWRDQGANLIETMNVKPMLDALRDRSL